MSKLEKGALVLYKSAAAIISDISDKIELITQTGQTKRVRDKDIKFIHPGPVKDFSFLDNLPSINRDNLEEVVELVADESLNLSELAEYIFIKADPAASWLTYKILSEDTYFYGEPDAIKTRELDEARQRLSQQEKKLKQKQKEAEFIKRLKLAKLTRDDFKKISDIEQLASGLRDKSTNLEKAGFKQDSASAHKYLVKTGYWDKYFNPYPKRNQINLSREEITLPEAYCIERTDLTHLKALAIDDATSVDPDDAISLDGDKFWVHVADPAALVCAGGTLDAHAGEQPLNLYLPEKTVHMLPREVTKRYGLGLSANSDALSIGFRLQDGEPVLEDLLLSDIKVTRISYSEAETRLGEEPLTGLLEAAMQFKASRLANGALNLNLPKVSVKTKDKIVKIESLAALKSRELVMEFMLMAGVAVARKMFADNTPFIYSSQEAPIGEDEYMNEPKDYAGMIGLRSRLQKSKSSIEPARHYGLGLDIYSQITSPLRRYSDLCNHQQLHNYIEKTQTLTQEEIANKLTGLNDRVSRLRRTERDSGLFWKIVYLKQNPDWRGTAYIVENDTHKSRVLIPELALETKLMIKENNTLNRKLILKLSSTDIYDLSANFKICH